MQLDLDGTIIQKVKNCESYNNVEEIILDILNLESENQKTTAIKTLQLLLTSEQYKNLFYLQDQGQGKTLLMKLIKYEDEQKDKQLKKK